MGVTGSRGTPSKGMLILSSAVKGQSEKTVTRKNKEARKPQSRDRGSEQKSLLLLEIHSCVCCQDTPGHKAL